MKPTFRLLFVIAAALANSSISHAQNLVVNGSFETPVLHDWIGMLPTNVLAPWQTTADTFEVWTNLPPSFPSADGSQNLEILSTPAEATIWQTITTIPGVDYAFSFFHTPRNGADSVLTVSINSRVVATFYENGKNLAGSDWHRFRTNFTATGNSTTMRFADIALGSAGTHIDGVSVERLPLSLAIRVSEVELSWDTVTNKVYQVQYRSALTSTSWTDLGAANWGNGGTSRLKDVAPDGEPQRIYRVITIP